MLFAVVKIEASMKSYSCCRLTPNVEIVVSPKQRKITNLSENMLPNPTAEHLGFSKTLRIMSYHPSIGEKYTGKIIANPHDFSANHQGLNWKCHLSGNEKGVFAFLIFDSKVPVSHAVISKDLCALLKWPHLIRKEVKFICHHSNASLLQMPTIQLKPAAKCPSHVDLMECCKEYLKGALEGQEIPLFLNQNMTMPLRISVSKHAKDDSSECIGEIRNESTTGIPDESTFIPVSLSFFYPTETEKALPIFISVSCNADIETLKFQLVSPPETPFIATDALAFPDFPRTTPDISKPPAMIGFDADFDKIMDELKLNKHQSVRMAVFGKERTGKTMMVRHVAMQVQVQMDILQCENPIFVLL